jgi:2-polyprenyl-3-methyl-5-hydroxy-6-metoxy-1,4-benzoquinol methylase
MTDNGVEDYGWTTADPPPSCRYVAPCVLATLKGLPIKRVLDVASGNGALCGQLAAAGYHVAGVEPDKQGVEVSRRRHPQIAFYNFGVHSDPAELLAHEEAFDGVVSVETIEHLFSPHLLPIYARSVLRQDGYLIVTTPYHGYLKNLGISILNRWDAHHTALWHGGHIKFWSRATLSRLLSDNGFRVVGFAGVGRLPYLWKSMVLVAQKA